jgi:glycosyltransferase domain-containing protein
MKYANEIRLPFRVLIADGGADETVPRVLADRSAFPYVDYEYVRYPFDETYGEYYAKVESALSRIETPLAVMADNDDFYLVDGLRHCAGFLAGNLEYVSCRGVSGGFDISPDDSYGELSGVYGRRVELVIPDQTGPIDGDTASERVATQLMDYSPTFYDIHRTADLWQCFRRLTELNPENILIAELVTSLLTVAAGKAGREPCLYLIRQRNTQLSNARIDRSKWGDSFNRMLSESWSRDFAGFANSVAEAIADRDGLPRSDALSHVKQGYRKYVAPLIVAGAKGSLIQRLKRRVVGLPSQSKERRLLRRVYRSYAAGRGFAGSLLGRGGRTRAMSMSRPSEYRDELRSVYEVLRAPPAESPDSADRQTGAVRR